MVQQWPQTKVLLPCLGVFKRVLMCHRALVRDIAGAVLEDAVSGCHEAAPWQGFWGDSVQLRH
eukprot:416868-Alexandrium_andersonii.AAC.1